MEEIHREAIKNNKRKGTVSDTQTDTDLRHKSKTNKSTLNNKTDINTKKMSGSKNTKSMTKHKTDITAKKNKSTKHKKDTAAKKNKSVTKHKTAKNTKKMYGSKNNKIRRHQYGNNGPDGDNIDEPKNEINVNKIMDIIGSENKRNCKDKKIQNIKTILEKPDKTVQTNPVKLFPINNIVRAPSKEIMDSYLEAKDFLKKNNILISTITLDCKLHTLIDVDVFAKNVVLREDEIVSVKFGNRKDAATNRTIIVLKNKKKPSVKNFYNQVTILMKPQNNLERNYINIKVFKNGSLQMTGCKDMDDFNNVTSTLINILKRGKDVVGKKGKVVNIKFIEEPDKIGIFDTKIRMIVSAFKVNYKIDRKKLVKLLKKHHHLNTRDQEIGYVEFRYEPIGGHSCVNIKYKYNETSKPSIFVFQTGSIIITGAKTLHHIIMAYKFINKLLDRYHEKIRIIELDHLLVQAEILKYLKSVRQKQLQNKAAN